MLIRHKETGAVLAEIPGNSITGADLSGRDLRGADLRGLTIVATAFREANVSHADVTGATFIGCDLTGADMSELLGPDVRFVNTVLTDVDLSRAQIPRIKVEHVLSPVWQDVAFALYVVGAALVLWSVWTQVYGTRDRLAWSSSIWLLLAWGAWDVYRQRRLPGWRNPRLWKRLYRAPSLARASFAGACLSHGDLSGVDLHRSTFSRAVVRDAAMAGTLLQHADFSNANLTGTNLLGANLVGANLTGADLSGVDLSLALLVNASLGSAVYDETTKWPKDFERVHPAMNVAI